MASPSTDSQTQATSPPVGPGPTVPRYTSSHGSQQEGGTFSIATPKYTLNDGTYQAPDTTAEWSEGDPTQTDRSVNGQGNSAAPAIGVPLYDADAKLTPIRHAISENSDELCVIGFVEGILYKRKRYNKLVLVARTIPIILSSDLRQKMSPKELHDNASTNLVIGAQILRSVCDTENLASEIERCLRERVHPEKLGTWGSVLRKEATKLFIDDKLEVESVERKEPKTPPRDYYHLRIDYADEEVREAEKVWSGIYGSDGNRYA
jgi:hypothetical protein